MANNVKSVLWLAGDDARGHGRSAAVGSLIVVGSIGGLIANTVIGAYGMSKAADHHLVRNLAAEWGPKNVRVNAIAPGLVKTDFARALWEDPKRAAERDPGDAAAPPGRAARHRRHRGVPGLRRRGFHHRPVHRRRRRRYHSVAVDLELFRRRSRVPRRSARLAGRESAAGPEGQDGELRPPLEGRSAALAQDPRQEGLGRAGVAEGMGRHRLERGAALHLRGGARLRRRAAADPVRPRRCARRCCCSFGTEAQKQRFLPRIYHGDDFWCQGYSEPGSGSDLASLKTKAQSGRATTTSSTARRSGPRSRTTPTGSSAWCAPTRASSGARKASRSC